MVKSNASKWVFENTHLSAHNNDILVTVDDTLNLSNLKTIQKYLFITCPLRTNFPFCINFIILNSSLVAFHVQSLLVKYYIAYYVVLDSTAHVLRYEIL